MYKQLLIPTDGSDLADKAVEHGVALARAIGAKVTALTVTEPFHIVTGAAAMLEDTPTSYLQRMRDYAATVLGAVAARAQAAGVVCETVHVSDEHPYKAIIDTARSQGCDLIVMASHGRRGMAALVVGSETVKVLTHSTIPVLVYR